MKKETFILLFSIIFVVNSYGQCPKAEMYKRKSEKAFNDGNKALRNNPTLVGANYNSNQMGAPDAYIILSAYEAYVCQCKNQNNGKKATELKNFINREYVQRYASMVSKYGSMPRITSCKGGNSKDKTASLKNSNRNSSTNSNPLITNKDISDFLKGNKEEREQVLKRVKRKQDVNNTSKVFGLDNQTSSILVDGMSELANLININKKPELNGKEQERYEEFKKYLKKIDRIKEYKNTNGSYKVNVPFNYIADFTDNNWSRKESEYVDIDTINKNTIEINFKKDLDFKDLRTNNHYFLVFKNNKFNVGKDFEITLEYGFDAKHKKYNKYELPLNVFISNNTVFRLGNLSAIYHTVFTPYTNYSYIKLRGNRFHNVIHYENPEFGFYTYIPKPYIVNSILSKKILEELPDKPFLELNTSEQKIVYQGRKNEIKKLKKTNKAIKKIKEKTYWVYNKARIVKKGEKIKLYYEVLNENLEKTEKRSLYFPFKYVDENKIFLGINALLLDNTKNLKFRIRNFEIKQIPN